MTGPDGNPELERIGMGWEWQPHKDLTLRITRLKERSDEFTGELTVICPKAGRLDGVLEWGRMNLMSAQTRASLAKRIDVHVQSPWDEWLDVFFREVVHRERQGELLQETDPDARPQPLRYMFNPILPVGMPTLMYGSGGVGKSTIAAGIAVSVQSGMSVFDGWGVVLSAPVLILDWEADRWVWQDRINAIARGANVTGHRIKHRSCRRRIVDDAEAIADMIVSNNIGLVIVDAVNQAFGVSSEMQDKAEPAIKAFSVIREIVGATTSGSREGTATDVTWLLIDHTGGDDLREEAHATPMKAYGTTAKQWLSRNQFYVASEKEATEVRQELVLKQTKANYAWKMPPTPLIIERDDAGDIRFTIRDEITAPELERQLSHRSRILKALGSGALSRQEIAKRCDYSDKSQVKVMNENLRRMLQRQDVIEQPDGKFVAIGKIYQAPLPDPDKEPI